MREGTRRLLEQEPDLRVVGEVGRGDEVVQAAMALQPRIALLDLRLPNRSGVELAKDLAETCPGCRPVILSAFDDEEYVIAALEAGAAAYLIKTIPSQRLVDALRRVARGEVVLEPSVSSAVVRHLGRRDPKLSRRECAVLALVSRGLPNKRIANQLGISNRTVENHIARILEKLGLSSRTEAAVYALEHHLLELSGES